MGIWEHLLPKKQVRSRIVRKKSTQKTEILGGKQRENMFSKKNENKKNEKVDVLTCAGATPHGHVAFEKARGGGRRGREEKEGEEEEKNTLYTN